MSLPTKYPKLFNQLEDQELELRHLLNVDRNEEDYDSEEFEFDFEEYNFIVYIAEPIQQVLGEEKMQALMVKLSEHPAFEHFRADEIDLYGVKSTHSEEALVALILDEVEALV